MPVKLTLGSSISLIPSIGRVYQKRLENIGIKLVSDLVYYFPFRYEDLSNQKQISDTDVGETITLQATLWQITKIRTKTGKTLIKALVNDSSGSIDVIWFNQTYLLTILKANQLINLSGKIGLFGNRKTVINPKFELIRDSLAIPIHTQRLVPVYSEVGGLTNKFLRSKIYQLLFKDKVVIKDFLPEAVLKNEHLISLEAALKQIHFPDQAELAQQSRERLAFDELLLLQLVNLKQKFMSKHRAKALIFKLEKNQIEEFMTKLPFKLTNSQKNAILEIIADLKRSTPMNRLLQGEVGSGKTVVSCFPILACIKNGYQAAILAPTEILAKQHFNTINAFLSKNYKVVLHTGSTKAKTSKFDVIVGTHALLNKKIVIERLGLVVIDEQQRFGVIQRSILKNQNVRPHFLTMTATPIPRTLALTFYGNLDISVLDEIPSGRKTVKTYLVPKAKRDSAYQFIKKEINKGGQAFIICPLIEISETLTSVKSAKAEYDRLKDHIFPEFKLDLLHGKLNSKSKDQVIANFKSGQTKILVSTPVVEVGIDISGATIMVIEAAERFGLASLHQLRGRVGRNEKQGYCLLFTENQNQNSQERLKLMERYNNGLALSEMDLKKRGPGELYGTAQSGQFNLKLASSSNLDLIIRARSTAEKLFETGLKKELEAKLIEFNQDLVIQD